MKRMLPLLIVLLALIVAYVLYSFRAVGPQLNVDPHAREEIEKAKRR